MRSLLFLGAGTLFGLVLSRSGAADYNYIQGMFLFTEFQLYGIIGSAVVLTAPGLWLYKRFGTTITGQPIRIKPKDFHKGTILGGILFGVGWSITGMCPGPIIVNIGEGKIYALAAFAGVLCGALLFGTTYEKTQKILNLPDLSKGTGCG